MRERRDYNKRAAWTPPADYGFKADEPVPGFYKMRLRAGGVYAVVKIVYGPPLDPLTGDEMDRSWRWMAYANGELIPFEDAWPKCAKLPATEDDYRRAIARQRWAQEHAPGTAYADPRAKYDPLTAPLPW